MKHIVLDRVLLPLAFIVIIITGPLVLTRSEAQYSPATVRGAVFQVGCFGAVGNALLNSMMWLQTNAGAGCGNSTANLGTPFPPGILYGLRMRTITTASNNPADSIAIYVGGVVTSITCTFGTSTLCEDLAHSVSIVDMNQVTVKVQSQGGAFTGPTYVSGSASCTNGTQAVAFTNGGGSGATGTITIAGGVPSGAVTMTVPFNGLLYTSVPTAGTIATCTGAGVFTGGTYTADTLSGLSATFQFIPAN